MQILIELQRSFVIYIAQLIFNVYYYWVSTDRMTSKHPKTGAAEGEGLGGGL